MFRTKFLFILTVVFLFLSACTHHDEKGTESNPIRVSLIPSKESGSLLMAGTEFKKWMEAETGFHFDVTVPNNYVAVIEALGSKKADIAFLTTSGYNIAFKKYAVKAHFITVNPDGKTNYRGQFIVRADSNIKTLQDLNGKKIAYVDPSSASGYIMPAHLLKQKNIKPSEVVFAGKHDAVVTMLYQKQVEAGATYYAPPENGEIQDARHLVKVQYPDVESQIKILDFTSELPNDALVFRNDLEAALSTKLEAAIEKWIQTPEGKKTLKDLNNGAGLKKVNDDDYVDARKMLDDMDKAL